MLVRDDWSVIAGEDDILTWLDETFDERDDADEHRSKALERAGLPEHRVR